MIHITKHSKDRKMDNMQSINTNGLTNKFCIASSKKDMVCKSCYSNRQLKFYGNMIKPLQNNSDILSTTTLKFEDVPVINAQVFRFNSFGELINELHFRNLNFIASANPNATFALWTKRFKIVNKYYTKHPKPDNLILIHSSYKLNNRDMMPSIWYDKVFTVYDRWYASVNDIVINCQERCNECRICYTKNNIVSINELKK